MLLQIYLKYRHKYNYNDKTCYRNKEARTNVCIRNQANAMLMFLRQFHILKNVNCMTYDIQKNQIYIKLHAFDKKDTTFPYRIFLKKKLTSTSVPGREVMFELTSLLFYIGDQMPRERHRPIKTSDICGCGSLIIKLKIVSVNAINDGGHHCGPVPGYRVNQGLNPT